MKLVVNGEPHNHRNNGNIEMLLEDIGADREHTALMLNGAVIPAGDWAGTTLKENDEIELLVFVGGG